MANYQGFQLIKTRVKRTKKYNFSDDSSIAFYWFVLENIFNLQKYEIDKEKNKQGKKFLENVLFKSNILKNYLSKFYLNGIKK